MTTPNRYRVTISSGQCGLVLMDSLKVIIFSNDMVYGIFYVKISEISLLKVVRA